MYNYSQVNSREERTTIKNNSRTRLNGEIRYPEVRVIGSDGEQQALCLVVMPSFLRKNREWI